MKPQSPPESLAASRRIAVMGDTLRRLARRGSTTSSTVVQEEATEDFLRMVGTSEDELIYQDRPFRVALVERPGHKKILVGKEGGMIRDIGTAARLDLQQLLSRPVHLELFVRLEPGWRENRYLLADLDRHVIAGVREVRHPACCISQDLPRSLSSC